MGNSVYKININRIISLILGQGHGYENIDQPIPGNSVETASPHQFGGDKPPLTP